ncbi:PDR/VanB family oxidoreductase [Streptomyces acidicola]|uniref:PDR/VanB family oxidoreductase n=1 Tax=Streptomyces acidicola TaxID=2596892 RepID=UPI00128E106E|nr:PDR/VanB family oxidoreductase [Streptomyces acidicola]
MTTPTTRPTTGARISPRWWHTGYAAFAAATAVLILSDEDPDFPLIQTLAVIAYGLALVVSSAGALAPSRPGVRRLVIGFQLAYIPMQFPLCWASELPLLGMLLSVLTVIALRPRFPRLAPRARKVWLTLHVGLSVGWLGLSLAMTTLSAVGLYSGSHAARHGAYEIFHIFDLTIVIPSMALSIVTGVAIALGTPWGLIKHRWVLAKFVISLAIPVMAGVMQSPWVAELAERTEDPAGQPGDLGVALLASNALFVVLLWTATLLSVVKPGGRTRWGRKDLAARRAAPPDPARTAVPDIPAVVGEAFHVADDTVALTLRPTGGGPLPAWEPGAHIDVVLPSGLVRQYSLYGDPAERAVHRIAVLREPGGRGGSVEAHGLRPGTPLAVRPPRNHFPLADAPAHLFIAGGIGITPFLPMIDKIAGTGSAEWRLVYRGRSLSRMAFADQLAARHPDRVTLLPSDTHARPDLSGLLRQGRPGTAVYCCGPDELINAVEAAMPVACPHGTLHIERFSPRDRADTTADAPFDAELRRSGRTVHVPAGRSLLAAMHEVDPSLPASCTDGVCGSCVTRVLEGTPDHRDDVLQPYERDRRDVLYPCVSRSCGPRIVLDA